MPNNMSNCKKTLILWVIFLNNPDNIYNYKNTLINMDNLKKKALKMDAVEQLWRYLEIGRWVS